MIGGGFRFQHCLTIHFTFGIRLADTHFLFIWQPGSHGAGGNKHRRQMAERERRHDQAGDNFIAYAQIERTIKHGMRQANGHRHGDDFAAHQR